jgi:hypothetical protein
MAAVHKGRMAGRFKFIEADHTVRPLGAVVM